MEPISEAATRNVRQPLPLMALGVTTAAQYSYREGAVPQIFRRRKERFTGIWKLATIQCWRSYAPTMAGYNSPLSSEERATRMQTRTTTRLQAYSRMPAEMFT